MTSSTSALENSRRKIHTAACLIIGDEVLGGKVRSFVSRSRRALSPEQGEG